MAPLDQSVLFALRRVFLGRGFHDVHSSEAQIMWHLRTSTLINDLQIESTGMHPNRAKFLDIAGLIEFETRTKDDLFGHLDELKASNLFAGPFNVKLTSDPWEHLTFSQSQKRSTVRILDINSIFRLYIPQRTGIAT